MKKIISIIMVAVMVISACVISVSAALPTVGRAGDVDKNCDINIMDATFVQRMVASLVYYDAENILFADVDLDREVTIMDATEIQKWLVGLVEDSAIGKSYDYSIECHDFYSDCMSGSAVAGVPVTFTTNITAGSPMASYELYVNGRMVARSIDDNSLTYTFPKAGKYKVVMLSNAFLKTDEKIISEFVVVEKEENTPLGLKSAYSTGKYLGDYVYELEGITYHAEAMGGTAPYEYKFMFGYPMDPNDPQSGMVYDYQEYSDKNTYELPVVSPKKYGYTECVIKIRVMDATGEIYEYTDDIVFQHRKIG